MSRPSLARVAGACLSGQGSTRIASSRCRRETLNFFMMEFQRFRMHTFVGNRGRIIVCARVEKMCYVPLRGCLVHTAVLSAVTWAASVGQVSGTAVFFLLLSTSRAVQRSTGASTMATRLPRCFAAAAATAAAASAAATSGTPAGSTNAGQASRRRRNGEEEEEAKARRGPHSGLPASAFAEKVGYASSPAKHCGGNNVRPSIDAERRPSPSWKDAIASVWLGRVAYADASGFPIVVGEAEGGEGGGGDAVLPSLEEGEKPEFIQRADEQVRRRCVHAMFSFSSRDFCLIQQQYEHMPGTCMYWYVPGTKHSY